MSFLGSDDDDSESCTLSLLQEKVFSQLHEEPQIQNPYEGAGSVQTVESFSIAQPLFIVIDYFLIGSDMEPEIIVRLWPGFKCEERFVHLKQMWSRSKISIGDTAFVVGDWEKRDDPYGFYTQKLSCFITDSNGFFILLPQVLIQGTRLAESQDCERKAYLMDFLSTAGTNISMLKGTVVHELIQSVLKGTLASDIDAKLDNILDSKQEELYEINKTTETFKPDLEDYLQKIREIATSLESRYNNYHQFGKSENKIQEVNKLPPYGCKTVNEEENIWSFQWGVKGKIDATLKQNGRLFPLELKSGSSYRGGPRDSHILQLASYMFMMQEKYKQLSGQSGIIYYAKDSISFEVAPKHLELMHIIMRRNVLSHAISHGTVPPTTGKASSCNLCDRKSACAFLESGEKSKSKIADQLRSFLSFEPKQQYIDFFKKWEKILLDEMYVTRASQTMIWLSTVKKRTENGRAIAHLTAKRDCVGNLELIAEDPSYITSSMIQVSDYIMLTKSGKPPIIGRGRIIEIKENRITLEMYESSLKKIRIQSDFNDDVVEIKKEDVSNNNDDDLDEVIDNDLCIDKWETTSSVDICRGNLMSLFTGQASATGSRLIDLIVDYEKPLFKELTFEEKEWKDRRLNDDQNNAIRMAISAKDYMLLLGMPGTGKTTALVSLIKRMVDDGNRVLVASFTHTAVDNICLKMNEERVNYIRFARSESLHHDVVDHSIDKIVADSTADEIRTKLDSCQVFATTCLGCSHPLLDMQSQAGRPFDICVVDEASQISLPTVLGPISRSRRFILVGDHYQLPPITRYAVGNGEESPPSLFRLLSEANPEAIVTLRTQYRMNDEILSLCNQIVYGFRMRTGSHAVAKRRMKLNNLSSLKKYNPYHQEWLNIAMSSDPSIVFYNTDRVPMYEQKNKGSKCNTEEAATVSIIVVSLILCGLLPSKVGVISPYRTQVNFIRKAIKKQLAYVKQFFPSIITDDFNEEIEVHTVDKFQGRDKECIVFSSVKSNKRCSPGTHITDWQRLNVAVTRAKTKFILVGSMDTLSNSPFFKKMFRIIDEKCIYSLRNDFNEVNFEPFCTVASISSLADSQT
ncbi:hypothetical protein M9Y10_024020 [Tritrichomonas musculus]|uniref:DNA replication ATP-dependent helicase/nuclease n=1 Tax=Tritrichomonas musculus TaxID=1915356 RepID=A0ABR2KXK8_9EUKA